MAVMSLCIKLLSLYLNNWCFEPDMIKYHVDTATEGAIPDLGLQIFDCNIIRTDD
jgi:hypothetical protein